MCRTHFNAEYRQFELVEFPFVSWRGAGMYFKRAENYSPCQLMYVRSNNSADDEMFTFWIWAIFLAILGFIYTEDTSHVICLCVRPLL